jgi:small subunit ribosomal protein S6
MSQLYDLVLLLDSDAPSERRQEILANVESAVGKGGAIESRHEWGVRKLSYEIAHRKEGEYHLLQFTGPPELIESLQRTLRLTDGVLRFRVIKVKPGTPPPPAVRAPAARAANAEPAEPAAA